MGANRDLAIEARNHLGAALGVEPLAPDEMIGSMASLPLRGVTTDEDADALRRAIAAEDRFEVSLIGWPVRGARHDVAADPERVLVRVSAQRYNEPADYERLAEALVARDARRVAEAGGATAVGGAAKHVSSAIVTG
jgi:isopenicillin-N epimerase